MASSSDARIQDARRRTAIHMVVAMVVLLLPVVGITAWFTRYPAEPVVQAVDYLPVAEQAAREGAFAPLVPKNLPEGWVCTRASWTPAGRPGTDGVPVAGDTWQLGFLSPGEMYVGVSQRGGDAPPEPFVFERTREGSPDGTSVVDGGTWTRYVSEDGRTRSLVTTDDVVTVVSGDLPYEALDAFAATLVPVSS